MTAERSRPTRAAVSRDGPRRRLRRRARRARSLFTPAATLFGALFGSLFETRHRLSTSATASTTCGRSARALRSSQGRRPRPPSSSDASRGSLLGSGDTRRAAQRPPPPVPVPGSSGFPGFPDRDTGRGAPDDPPTRADGAPDERRARVWRPSEGRVTVRKRPLAVASVACAWGDMPTTFPFSAVSRAPSVTGAAACRGRDPLQTRRTGRDSSSSGAPRRAPTSDGSGAFHRRDVALRGLLLDSPRSASRSRRPHFFPRLGRVLHGHCKRARAGGSPPECFERADAFWTRGDRAWG